MDTPVFELSKKPSAPKESIKDPLVKHKICKAGRRSKVNLRAKKLVKKASTSASCSSSEQSSYPDSLSEQSSISCISESPKSAPEQPVSTYTNCNIQNIT